jgi:hypothetical protein
MARCGKAVPEAGVVFHTGPRAYRLGEGIIAAPISALWA